MRIMTEKISPCLRRDARSTFGNICIGATHTESTNQPTNQNLQRSVCGGCRPPTTLARISTPFPASPTPHRAATLHLSRTSSRLRASLSTSSPARLPVSSSPFIDDDGVCVYRRHLPRPRSFRNSFRPESIPPPRRVETVGAPTVGVQRVQPSVLGLSLVSLVTAPHKGIAL